MASSRIVIAGPATWNHLIKMDHLPEPVPHTQFAQSAWHTVGGTSAGKALHLAGLGADVELWTSLDEDTDGTRVKSLLETAGVHVQVIPSKDTERHVNLMAGGSRVSIYVSTVSAPTAASVAALCEAVMGARVAVIDLSVVGQHLLDLLPVEHPPLWMDLHDYDGSSTFHEPFLCRSSTVFMNDDGTDDPWTLMKSCLERGPQLAVCTLGAKGAIALEADGTRHHVAAAPATIVDTNGAGDAFMAGFLAATLNGNDVQEALSAAAHQATEALKTRHLHPVLAELWQPID